MEKSVRHVATIAVINPNTGSILMGKRRDSGLWTTPGGHLEMGEHPGEGARRELLEEAGVAADKLKYLGATPVTSRDGKPLMIHCFVHEGMPKTTSKNDPDKEVAHWEWISTKNGLPDHVASNLHAPKNILLQKLGLQEKESLEKAAKKKPIQERSYVAAARNKPLQAVPTPEPSLVETSTGFTSKKKNPSIMSQIEQSKRPVTPITTDESMYSQGPERAGTGSWPGSEDVGSTVAGGHKRNLDYDENPDLVLGKKHIHKTWKGHADHLVDGLQPDTGFIKSDTLTRGIRIANNTKAGHKTLLKPELGIEDYERVNDEVSPHFLDPNFTSAHREAATIRSLLNFSALASMYQPRLCSSIRTKAYCIAPKSLFLVHAHSMS
jgi:8-oxo-dGTP diphosphatase